jgi:hypothetical protein
MLESIIDQPLRRLIEDMRGSGRCFNTRNRCGRGVNGRSVEGAVGKGG